MGRPKKALVTDTKVKTETVIKDTDNTAVVLTETPVEEVIKDTEIISEDTELMTETIEEEIVENKKKDAINPEIMKRINAKIREMQQAAIVPTGRDTKPHDGGIHF
jgi:cytidylate kinase